ncbi:MAG: SLC13 family permease [Acetobacteraceae bacterium]|jgi:di/tricarboxylate transporter|nr:SLC13 family permease [Acetobacteraceae bacterium]
MPEVSPIAIVFGTILVMVLLFAWGRFPVAIVALCATLSLHAAGILTLEQALAGFGDRTMLFIGALFVVSAGLEAGGVTGWVGTVLIRFSGASRRRLLTLTMLLVAGLTALIGVGGAAAALLPVVTLVAVRLGRSPSQLLMPMAFAAHAGSMLALTGSLVNVVISDALAGIGEPQLGYFELSLLGVILLGGTIGLVVLLGGRLLPSRRGRAVPRDLSGHPVLLAEQYKLFDQLVRFQIPPGSPLVGARQSMLYDAECEGLAVVAIQAQEEAGPLKRPLLAAGDVVLLRGEPALVDELAERFRLRRTASEAASLQASLFNATVGYAEVMVAPRSGLIGVTMFPGKITESGELIVLGIRRGAQTLGPGDVTLEAGDTLLLQGSWQALEEQLQDPDVLVVHAPEAVRRQTITLGAGASRALAVSVLMVAALASGAVPSVLAVLLAAIAMVVLGVLKIEEAFQAINGGALIMVASLMPLATAMDLTGAADLIVGGMVELLGSRSQMMLFSALFLLTALLAQAISSTATALMVIPIAIAVAKQVGASPRAALICVAVAAAASFLTPVASSANMMVKGPAGYRFGDYWKLGLPLMLWFFLVAVLLVPFIWRP